MGPPTPNPGEDGTLEDRPIYTKTQIFDPFPFPNASDAQRARIAGLASELDTARNEAVAELPGRTMTEIYSWRDKLRAAANGGAALCRRPKWPPGWSRAMRKAPPKRRLGKCAGCVRITKFLALVPK